MAMSVMKQGCSALVAGRERSCGFEIQLTQAVELAQSQLRRNWIWPSQESPTNSSRRQTVTNIMS